jgi:hypothetical protein
LRPRTTISSSFASATTCCLPIFARPGTQAASSGQRGQGTGDHRLGGGRRQPRAEAIGAVAHQPPASRPGQDFCAHDAALAGS